MYDYSYHWLVLGSKLNDSVPFLNDSAYSIITDFALAITNGSNYDLYDVYNHCKYRGGALNVTKLGFWQRETGIIITLTQPLIQRRANMHGMTLKISGVVRIIEYIYAMNKRNGFFNNYPTYRYSIDRRICDWRITCTILIRDPWIACINSRTR